MKELLFKIKDTDLIEPYRMWQEALWYEFYTDGTFRKTWMEVGEYHQWKIVDNYVMFRKPCTKAPTGWQCYYLCNDNKVLEKLARALSNAIMEREFFT